MSNENLIVKGLDQRPIWFNVLLLLDVFVLGGVVVWRFVLNLLDTMMKQSVEGECMGDIPHLLDQMLPYWLSSTGVLLLLGLLTVGAYMWLRIRSSSV